MEELGMTIDGELVTTSRRHEVTNPATGNVLAGAPECDSAHLDAAVAAAEKAFEKWSSNESLRIDTLAAICDAIERNADELASLITDEQGKTLKAAHYEVREAIRWIRSSAAMSLPSREDIPVAGRHSAIVAMEPYGVTAAITPWNFPLLMLAWKLGPALRAGNTLVVKPSPYTPLATLRIGELLADVVPPGTVNVISGGAAIGEKLVSHPRVSKVAFTGSVATGKRVGAACVATMKSATLELGGNDAAIVLDDIDVRESAKRIFWGAFTNNGQVCAGIKRLYVDEKVHDSLVSALRAIADEIVVGPGRDSVTDLGPVQNRAQFDHIRGLIEEARKEGATIADSGRLPNGNGFYLRPTLVTDISDSARIVVEEQFGPALPIISFRSIEEAIQRANDSSFGLSGSVWSADVERASAIAGQMACGMTMINTHIAVSPDVPFGGWKNSGNGVENGRAGLEGYLKSRTSWTPA